MKPRQPKIMMLSQVETKPKQAPQIDLDDPKLLAMIDGGGETVTEKKKKTKEQEPAPTPTADELKNFSIRIFQSELDDIKKHLKGFGGRKTKSIHTFILEAIGEKLKRESKKA
jgi:hypothetical protein